MTGSLDAERHAAQFAFAASGADLVVGSTDRLPWSAAELATLDLGDAAVLQRLDSGLTARVYRLTDGTRHWTLKRARPQALVHNNDGQTSFLNEVQRRADLQALKRQPGGEQRWAAIVDTEFAAYRQGVILSPWIEGQPVQHWDERRLVQLFEVVCALWTEGLFEWDLCSGNILDDGRQLRLFDFGYMYRFDPLRQFNSAGNGSDQPMFHPAERFETRHHAAHLLTLAEEAGEAAALQAFRLEKAVATEAYRQMRSTIAPRGAAQHVIDWLDSLVRRWHTALQGSAEALYRSELWRSHVLDLHDDLSGRSCTPMTLRRVDWLLDSLVHHHDALRAGGAFFGGDDWRGRDQLLSHYRAQRQLAATLQTVRETTDTTA
ncbi:hypothetical protein [Ideonella sp. BN130291]|uniref:hypothetical protein n=1 Tax=Ideonella sp. BN130291 TaxID=3112940 RepID=UPI002E274252|nr:hypothetical protein [Ideonella sp. BN130291]